MQKLSLFVIIYLNLIFSSFCILEEETPYDLYLKITGIKIRSVGNKGIIAFVTNSTSTFDLFNILDIADNNYEMQISFQNSEEKYNVSCNFWKPQDDNLIILCKLKQNLAQGEQYIALDEYILNHDNKSIKIFSEDFIRIYAENKDYPFLYSDKQIIDFNDGKKEYEIKFKVGLYNGENLVLSNYDSLKFINLGNDCNIKGKELICKISKDKFENYLIDKESTFAIMTFGEAFGMINFELIFDIIIKYNVNKKNIDVNIKKLINDILSNEDFAVYETDITQITEVSTKTFNLNFTNDDGSFESQECVFRKYEDNKPLLLLCTINWENDDNLTLSEIKQDIKIENINAKYNFVIKPVKNTELIKIGGRNGGIIYSIYPDILDYTKNDNYKVIIGGGIAHMNGLTLFPESDDLICENEEVYIVCNIPKNYFEGKKNGYYYVYHTNHLGTKSINYEAPPIKVILTNEEKNASPYLKVNIFRNLLILLLILSVY